MATTLANADAVSQWHILSCEYPPQIGGVSSYVGNVAAGLAREGHDVHVWCPPAGSARADVTGVMVHGELGRFRPKDVRRTGRLLNAFPAPRRLLVQWVPHGYGYRSMNLPFCLWLASRARSGDLVDLMVHEPFLAFAGRWTQHGAAAVHRLMTMVLLRAARRVWVSTPAWRDALAPFAPSRDLVFDWLPIPSPVEPLDEPQAVAAVRSRLSPAAHVVGHFGLYSRLTAEPMKAVIPRVLDRMRGSVALLMGQGSEQLRSDILSERSELGPRVHAAGVLPASALSHHLQACDLLVQPYPEGITSRRTSTMAPLAHGLAVVTTEGRASEPIWREEGAVALARAGDLDGIVAAVERLLEDDVARRALGARARALYDGRFHARHTLTALLAT